MKRVVITKGMFALVDDEDYTRVNAYSWQAARRHARYQAKNDTVGLMHRFIMSPPDDMTIDHIDGNPLNNQKANLRLATNSENLCNRGKTLRNTSGYKGVSWGKAWQLWRAVIAKDNKAYELGFYDTALDAHIAYCYAARDLHGVFANVGSHLDLENLPPMPKKKDLNRNNTSGFKGVYRERRSTRWLAALWADGKLNRLGVFATALEASEAYQKELLRLRAESGTK